MVRLFCSLILVFAFVISFDAPSAQAQISRDNPYRSFNISGVNYGSMRWEEQHRNQNQTGRTNMATQSMQSTPQANTQRGIFGFRRFRR